MTLSPELSAVQKEKQEGPARPLGSRRHASRPPELLEAALLLLLPKKRKKAPKLKASLHFHILSYSQKLPDSWKTACLSSHQQMSTKPKGEECCAWPRGDRCDPDGAPSPSRGPTSTERAPVNMQGDKRGDSGTSPRTRKVPRKERPWGYRGREFIRWPLRSE